LARKSAMKNLSFLLVITFFGASVVYGAGWSHFAADPSRNSTAAFAPPSLQQPRWTVQAAADEEYIFAATPVASGGRVFAAARVFVDSVHDSDRVIAYRQYDGHRIWSAQLEADVFDSWSSPVVDTRNDTVVFAAGSHLRAFRTSDGS